MTSVIVQADHLLMDILELAVNSIGILTLKMKRFKMVNYTVMHSNRTVLYSSQ